jgi:hypothetical protein
VADSTDILIGEPDGQRVLIQPQGRQHPGLFDYWDGNWIVCRIDLTAGGFRGGFEASLRSEEFQAFLEELENLVDTLESTAAFSTMEGQLAFSLTGDGVGHIHLTGEAQDLPGGNRLHFEFEVDQTCLAEIRRSVERVLTAFPVTGAQPAS